MSRILIVDCFDSFSYNIYHYLEQICDGEMSVVRYNDFVPSSSSNYSHIVLSPGPGLPEDYPKISEFLEIRDTSQSVLGVCLGVQCIAQHYGAKLSRLDRVKHGLSGSIITSKSSLLFADISENLTVGHYHSWVVSKEQFPSDTFHITSHTKDGLIMSLEHKKQPIYGVQFHPESVLTSSGLQIFKNWLEST